MNLFLQNKNYKPFQLLWLGAAFILLPALSVGRRAVIDIQLHDAYLVLDFQFIGILASIVLAIFGLIYYLLRKSSLTPWMSYAHAWLSNISIGYILCCLLIQTLPDIIDTSINRILNISVVVLIFLFMGAQVLFLVNVLRSGIRAKSN